MKVTKQTLTSRFHIEKILTIAGLGVIVVGCIANLFGAYTNQRFVYDPLDIIYYLRFIILLVGGFTIGYLFTKKINTHTRYSRLFTGVVYALLAFILFLLFDVLRIITRDLFGFDPGYPWGKILFIGAPLLAIVTVLCVAFFSQYKTGKSEVGHFTKLLIVLSFIITQLYTLFSLVLYLSSDWLTVISYLTTPFIIALVAYLLLRNTTKRVTRLFYASLIGILYGTLTYVLWEFRTDPSHEATNIFSNAVSAITVLFAGILMWQIYRAIKH